MAKSLQGEHPAARRAADKALLQKIGFDHFFNSILALAQRGGDSFDPDRAAAVIFCDAAQIAMIHGVKAERIDLKLAERRILRSGALLPLAIDRGEIAHAPQQPSRQRAACPGCAAPPRGRRPASSACRARAPALHDLFQLIFGIEVEPDRNAEAVPQRRRKQTRSCGRANEREFRKIDADRACGGAFADDEVELEILHRRIEDFFDRRVQPMDFIDKKYVALLKIGEQRRQVARLRDHRPGRHLEIHAKLARDDLRKRRFAEAGGPAKST